MLRTRQSRNPLVAYTVIRQLFRTQSCRVRFKLLNCTPWMRYTASICFKTYIKGDVLMSGLKHIEAVYRIHVSDVIIGGSTSWTIGLYYETWLLNRTIFLGNWNVSQRTESRGNEFYANRHIVIVSYKSPSQIMGGILPLINKKTYSPVGKEWILSFHPRWVVVDVSHIWGFCLRYSAVSAYIIMI